MSKQKWLWGIIVLLLVVSSTGIMMRWNAEQSNDSYEIVIPYDEIQTANKNSDLTIDEILSSLKEAGLTTVSLEPLTLKEMEKQNLITVYKENDLAAQLLFTPYKDAVDVTKSGSYIRVPENESYRKLIMDSVEPEEVQIGEEAFYFLPTSNHNFDLKTPIGYDQPAIDMISKHGLGYVFKVENADNEVANAKLVNQLLALKDGSSGRLLGQGDEAIGFGQEKGNQLVEKLSDAGYYFYTIESNPLKGENKIAQMTDYNMIRLHSININRQTKLKLNESIDRTTRAVKERNIRSIFYHIKTTGNAKENVEQTIDYLNGVHDAMPDHFQPGEPKLFDQVAVPAWVTAAVLVAGILFTFIVSDLIKWMPLRIAAAGFMTVLAIAYFILKSTLFLQAFALIIAVLAPTYAVIKSAQGSTKMSKILVQYLKAVAISLIGIVIVIGLLNGNAFMTGFATFKGVKLVYLIPIMGVLLFTLIEINRLADQNINKSLSNTVTLLNKELKYWHVLLLIVVAGIGLFYISRTGNSGSVSDLELTFRQWLENTLYVRPRTKEFLIGFPFFVLALYVMGINRKWGSILLVPGVIGFLSIVNTFTHLHIPVAVSVLRTLYSVSLGFVIGLVFILIFKFGYRWVSKAIARWS
ncbi:hypothetical protein J2D69_02635 [Lysinibacillus sphaericus]|uniref:Uncharacterized protein n=3 Tax=Lysinibacillus TaxID=400634 RepID=B1HM77_LYSSC|nr:MULTISPECIES: DUF5693 family protein [Lysinibacillus]MBE5082054.1 hypothetical protein [Bacillus thuringiensis]ACA38649.1 conserved hypothetical protein [Lysinibacillus sphaericus C3-41]AMO31081.1 hypothetical protein AR327_00335 [Lysinibacillus sphaericus]AMR89812.1 hypothetical protein A1T07_06340 [Lysinibacillus sphaericus]ANA47883.1 hypothetical protein A2J09_21550 [Lysinibacillus sphaericus]